MSSTCPICIDYLLLFSPCKMMIYEEYLTHPLLVRVHLRPLLFLWVHPQWLTAVSGRSMIYVYALCWPQYHHGGLPTDRQKNHCQSQTLRGWMVLRCWDLETVLWMRLSYLLHYRSLCMRPSQTSHTPSLLPRTSQIFWHLCGFLIKSEKNTNYWSLLKTGYSSRTSSNFPNTWQIKESYSWIFTGFHKSRKQMRIESIVLNDFWTQYCYLS